jgi:hypothetical protein
MWNLDIKYIQKYTHTYIHKHAYIQKCNCNGKTVWRGMERGRGKEKDGRG